MQYSLGLDAVNKSQVYKKETQLNCKILVRNHLQKITSKLPQTYFIGNINNCDFNKLPSDYVIKPRCMYGGKGITFVRNNINLIVCTISIVEYMADVSYK